MVTPGSAPKAASIIQKLYNDIDMLLFSSNVIVHYIIQEIGPPIIERCRGYTEQLSTMVTKQHERVAQDYHYYRDIRDSLSSVVHLCQDVDNINIFNGLPDQEETKEWKVILL